MGKLWIRFGCFLTGYNYRIVRNSSEVSAKAVKRYTAAMLIVCILWAFIGYTFTQRYLHGELWGSVAGAIILVVIVVQIERQIILSIQYNGLLYLFRSLIAVMMAVIGAVIIDQVLFKDDIDLEKITVIEDRVKEALPGRTEEYRRQIQELDTTIQAKEIERQKLIADVSANPLIKSVSTQSTQTLSPEDRYDSTSGKMVRENKVKNLVSVSVTKVANPNQLLISPLEETIQQLREQRADKENLLLNVRPKLVEEITSKVGFLDELKVMYKLIKGSGVALFVWLLWFFFLTGLEMLVLVSKMKDKRNDYEQTVLHQMNHQLRKLELLSKMTQPN